MAFSCSRFLLGRRERQYRGSWWRCQPTRRAEKRLRKGIRPTDCRKRADPPQLSSPAHLLDYSPDLAQRPGSRPANGALGAFFLKWRCSQCPDPKTSPTENHRPTNPTSVGSEPRPSESGRIAMIQACTAPPAPPSNPHKKLAKKIQIPTKENLILSKMARTSLFRRFHPKRNAPDDGKHYEITKQTHSTCSAADQTNGAPRFQRPRPDINKEGHRPESQELNVSSSVSIRVHPWFNAVLAYGVRRYEVYPPPDESGCESHSRPAARARCCLAQVRRFSGRSARLRARSYQRTASVSRWSRRRSSPSR